MRSDLRFIRRRLKVRNEWKHSGAIPCNTWNIWCRIPRSIVFASRGSRRRVNNTSEADREVVGFSGEQWSGCISGRIGDSDRQINPLELSIMEKHELLSFFRLILFKNGGNPNPNLCFTALSLRLIFDWGWNTFIFRCKRFEAAVLIKPMLCKYLLCFLFFFFFFILCPHYSSRGCVRPQFCVERLLWVSGEETDDHIYRDRVQRHQWQS